MINSSAVAVIAIFFVLCVLLAIARRRQRARLANRVRGNPPGRRLSKVRKPYNASVPASYPTYYQTAPPPPPPVHTPQYPPRGYETYRSQWIPPSTSQPIPQPTTTSPASTRPLSGSTPLPISSVDPTPFSVRSSVRRDELVTPVPSNPLSSSPLSSPRSTQGNVVGSFRSPSVVTPSAASSPPHQSAATSPPRNPPPSLPLASMSTGASYTIDEPPPAYTPV